MRSVTVLKKDLLDVVKRNRNTHRQVFEEACEGYREQAIAELEKMLNEAKKGKRIRRSVGLIEPMDQTKEYDRVIKMLEMSTTDHIELTSTEFAQYVQDDWAWKEQFSHSNTQYLKNNG